jgi:hypothetical protein
MAGFKPGHFYCTVRPDMTPDALAALPAGRRLILAAGTRRSGSTALFNMARLLLERQGGTLTAGWIEDIAEPLGATVLVKVHDWHPALAKRADVVLTCHRDLREVARSLAAIGWLQPGAKLFDQITNITHHYTQWQPAAAADLAYEDMVANWGTAVANVAAVLRISASPADIETIAREVGGMPAPAALEGGRKYDPVTLMHRGHRAEERVQPLAVESEIQQRFLSWQTAHGYR